MQRTQQTIQVRPMILLQVVVILIRTLTLVHTIILVHTLTPTLTVVRLLAIQVGNPDLAQVAHHEAVHLPHNR